MKLIIFILLLPLLTEGQTKPKVLVPIRVFEVHDGDGCKAVLPTGEVIKIRFSGVDAPEFKSETMWAEQPHAKQSRDTLRKWITNKTVLLDSMTMYGWKQRDQYGRMLGELYTLDTVSISVKLARAGCVWPYKSKNFRNKSRMREILESAKTAKSKKRGLWRPLKNPAGDLVEPVDPAVWRKMFRVIKMSGWQR